MKIYLIKGNNCEEYEDYYEWIEKKVFCNKDNAYVELKKLENKAKEYLKKDPYAKIEYEIKEYEVVDINKIPKKLPNKFHYTGFEEELAKKINEIITYLESKGE